MRVGQNQGQEAGGGNAHPLGGPPGQMWKQALAEGQAQGAEIRIPPGQQKKLGEQGGQAPAPDEEAARASLRLDTMPPGLRMLMAIAGPVNPGNQAGGR